MKFEEINRYIKTLDHDWILEPLFKQNKNSEFWTLNCKEIGQISFFLETSLQLVGNEFVCVENVNIAKITHRKLTFPNQKIIENVCQKVNKILLK